MRNDLPNVSETRETAERATRMAELHPDADWHGAARDAWDYAARAEMAQNNDTPAALRCWQKAAGHRYACAMLAPGYDPQAPCAGCGEKQGSNPATAERPGCHECAACVAALAMLGESAPHLAHLDAEPSAAELAELAEETAELAEYDDGRNARAWSVFDDFHAEHEAASRKRRDRTGRRLARGYALLDT